MNLLKKRHLAVFSALSLFAACADTPKRPTTTTPAPSLKSVDRNISGAQANNRKIRTYSQQIEDKVILLKNSDR